MGGGPGACIELRYPFDELRDVDASVFVQRLERRVQCLDDALDEARADLQSGDQEAQRARARIGSPFEHDAELQRLQRRQLEVNEQLAATSEATVTGPSSAQPMAANVMATRSPSHDARQARALHRR